MVGYNPNTESGAMNEMLHEKQCNICGTAS